MYEKMVLAGVLATCCSVTHAGNNALLDQGDEAAPYSEQLAEGCKYVFGGGGRCFVASDDECSDLFKVDRDLLCGDYPVAMTDWPVLQPGLWITPPVKPVSPKPWFDKFGPIIDPMPRT